MARRGRRLVPLRLLDEEQEALERFVRRRKTAQQLALRARVVLLSARGLSNREVAGALFVSVETIKTHMRALFEAFGVGDVPQYHKRTELVRRALETGLVTAHDLDER